MTNFLRTKNPAKSMRNGKKAISVFVPTALHKKTLRLAEKNDLFISDVVRQALEYLIALEEEATREE